MQTRISIAPSLGLLVGSLRVTVFVNGSLQYDGPVADERRDMTIDLPDGTYVIAVRAVASIPSGSVDERCTFEARAIGALHMTSGPAVVTIAVREGSLTESFDERLKLTLEAKGAVIDTDLPRSALRMPTGRCATLPALEAAICDAEERVAEARAQRDIVKTSCEDDKLTKLRALERVEDEARSAGNAGATPDPGDSASPTLGTTDARLLKLRMELDECVGEEQWVMGGPSGHTIEQDHRCAGNAALVLDGERL